MVAPFVRYVLSGINGGLKVAIIDNSTGGHLLVVDHREHAVALAVYQSLSGMDGFYLDNRVKALVRFVLATKGTDLGKALAKTL